MVTRRGKVSISAMLELVAVLAGSGCLREETAATHGVRAAEASRALIRSFPANDPVYDAIGSIVMSYSDGSGMIAHVPCTGAIIGPHAIVTAKHCLDEAYFSAPDYRLVFTVGPDTLNPIAYYDVVDFEGAPGDTGGISLQGHDVVVMYISAAASDIRPIGLGSLSESDVGDTFVAAGFGNSFHTLRSGWRRVGGLRLKAVEGRTWEVLYGSFEEFYRGYSTAPIPPECLVDDENGNIDCSLVEDVRARWEGARLENLGEFVAGGGVDEAQPCGADSGGPLLRADENGELIAYGVVSGVIIVSQNCDRGAVYAGFGEEVMEFLERAKDWVDPCGDVTWDRCTEAVTQRCTRLGEGKRRIVSCD